MCVNWGGGGEEKQIPDNAFSLAPNQGSISLSSTLGQAPTLLPDDHHYQPKSLARPFLRPHKLLGRLLLGRSQMPTVSPGVDAEEETNDLESAHVIKCPVSNSWYRIRPLLITASLGPVEQDPIPDDYGFSDDDEDSNMIEPEADPHSTTFGNEIVSNLIDLPRKVSKISVNYDRRAKQVDVRQLKSRLLDMLSGKWRAGGGDWLFVSRWRWEISIMNFMCILQTHLKSNTRRSRAS